MKSAGSEGEGPDRVTLLALAARNGDRAALSDFIRATQDQVWNFVARLADAEHADDLVQETYLRMLTALPTFAGRASARTWLLAIARRVVVDRWRRHQRQPGGLRHAPSPEPMVASAAMERFEIELWLRQLPPPQHEAFVLTQMLGFSYSETAAICGCAVGTIRSRVARARAQLVARLRVEAASLTWP